MTSHHMARHFKTQAIVLDHYDQGESDRVLTLLTFHRGKLRVTARGARNSKKRFAGCQELFAHIDVFLTETRKGTWPRMEEAVLLDAHEAMRGDLVSIAQAAYLAELVSLVLQENDEATAIFQLLLSTLRSMESGHLSALQLRWFEMQLLGLLGVGPHVAGCLECHAQSSPLWKFDYDRGGILCAKCGTSSTGDLVETPALRLFQDLQGPSPAPAHPKAAIQRVRLCLQRTIDRLVPRPLKSRDFLRQVAMEEQEESVKTNC